MKILSKNERGTAVILGIGAAVVIYLIAILMMDLALWFRQICV